MSATAATVETLQHVTKKRFGVLLDFSMFVDERTGRCNPAQATIAERGVERVSESTVSRAMGFFAKLGLFTRELDEITESYEYKVDKHYLPALIEARRVHRPDYRVRRRKGSPNCRPPSCKNARESINPSIANPEFFDPRAREESVEKQGGWDTSPASTAEASQEATALPSNAATEPVDQKPKPSSADEPAGPVEGRNDPLFAASSRRDVRHTRPSPARATRRFVPIGCRQRKPPEPARTVQDIVAATVKAAKRALNPRRIEATPRDLLQDKVARWLEKTGSQDEYLTFMKAMCVGVVDDETRERYFELKVREMRASGWNDIPLSAYQRNGWPLPPGPAPKSETAIPVSPPTPAEPPKSQHDVYRESMRIVAEEQARRRGATP